MKNLPKFLFILFFISLLLTVLLLSNRQNSPQTFNSSASEPSQNQPQRISVTAQNDSLEPNNFDLVQFQNYIFEINATDKDYQFTIDEFDVKAFLPQGQVTEVPLTANAIGTYNINCGPACTAQIHISDNDEDAVFE